MKLIIAIQLFLAAWLLPAASLAQQPKLEHAQLTVRSGGDLQGAIASMAVPGWIGYAVPTTHPMNNHWESGVRYLEGTHDYDHDSGSQHGESLHQQSSEVILLRVLGGRVSKVEISEPEQTLDAGGLPFVWVSDVSQSASLHVLAGVAGEEIASAPERASLENVRLFAASHAAAEVTLLAIALHSAPEATAVLRSFTTENEPVWVRERAAFWLADERGAAGFDAVRAMLRDSHDEELRAKLTFDFTLVKGDSHQAAVDELIALARNDASARVRTQAQFWLAQQVSRDKFHDQVNDARIADTLRQQASSDPDAAVRRSAVFALSRLPTGQATSELIRVASSSSDPAARREAVFWLGQSKDPHALDYLEKLAKQ